MIANIEKIKALLEDAQPLDNRGGIFYYGGIPIAKSPDGVKLYISIKKKENRYVTLLELVEKRLICSKESIEMAIEFWDSIEPISDEKLKNLQSMAIY